VVLSRRKKAIAIEGSYRDIARGYLLQRPLPASHELCQHHDTRHHRYRSSSAQQQALRNQTPPASPPRVAKWIAGTLSAVDRQTLFARLGPQRSTADCSAVVSPQNATARARYLPEMQAAALRVHPMWHVKSKQGLCVYFVRHQISLSSQSASHRKTNQAAHPICSEKLHA
jgi:hypothetical protein